MKWIPVNEDMPQEHESLFSKFKKRYPNAPKTMFNKKSDPVLVTIEDIATGSRHTDIMCTHDGEWYWHGVSPQIIIRSKVIAWMPYPEPYKGE